MKYGDFDINDDFWEFVAEHSDEDIKRLWLRHWDRDRRPELVQIEAVKKARNKIPTLLRNSHFLFPNVTVAEQCTNEWIARFHASLFAGVNHVIDLTAGLAIDSFYISKVVPQVTALELDETAASVIAANMAALEAKNVSVDSAEAVQWLREHSERHFDAAFIDPARRSDNSSRVYALEDCSPSIFDIIPLLLGRCRYIIVKASPMLDIDYIARHIEGVSHIWVVSFNGECKEVLFQIGIDDVVEGLQVSAVGISKNGVEWCVDYDWHSISASTAMSNCSTPRKGDVLFVPDAAIVKSGAWRVLPQLYPSLRQLHPTTLLYSASDASRGAKEGRAFFIEHIVSVKEAERLCRDLKQVNVAVRNFPLTAAQLRAKLKVAEGGDTFIFGCKVADGSLKVMVCRKGSD